MSRSALVVFFGMWVGAAAAVSGDPLRPLPVSPGSPDAYEGIDSPCPTFSWSAVEGATGYDVVVLAVGVEGDQTLGTVDPTAPEAPAAIRVTIDGPGLSWTPAVGSCLELSTSYAWAVRALRPAGAGDWSDVALFTVDPRGMVEPVAAAIERALSRYLEEQGVAYSPDGGFARVLAQELAGTPAAAGGAPYSQGRPAPPGGPGPGGVFVDDVELRLTESGSSSSDYVQLVFDTPSATGDAAWNLAVRGDNATMFLSTPSFVDAIVFFTDASTLINELRELTLRKLSSPPITCTSVQEGLFYWDDDLGELCDCDGSSWAQVDGGGACS